MENETAVGKRFAGDVEKHTVKVLHDEGLYRHLLCRGSDSWMYWFEIITTPGQLTIRGDMGTYVFARLDDMFEFFGEKERVNSQYWGEKLQASSGPIKRYSPQVAVKHAKEVLKDALEYRDLTEREEASVKHAFNSEVLPEAADEAHFRESLTQFNSYGIRFEDSWEWDLTEYDSRYLWNLYAIVWAIRGYRAAKVLSDAPQEEIAAS